MTAGLYDNLLVGVGVALNAAALGTWNTSGAYTSAQTGIVLGVIPQTPDRIIALTAYGISDSPGISDSVVGLQVRTRWSGADPRPVYDLDDALFSYLQGKTAWTLSTGVVVVECHRISGPASLGQDANNRWSLSSNYHLTVHYASTNRI